MSGNTTVLVWATLPPLALSMISVLTIFPILDAGKAMDASVADVEEALRPELAQFGQRKDNSAPGTIFDTLNSERFAERKRL